LSAGRGGSSRHTLGSCCVALWKAVERVQNSPARFPAKFREQCPLEPKEQTEGESLVGPFRSAVFEKSEVRNGLKSRGDKTLCPYALGAVTACFSQSYCE
jgi:hypothetical protein